MGMLAAFTSSSTRSRWENHSECFAKGAQAVKTAVPEPSQTEEPLLVGRDWCWAHGPSMRLTNVHTIFFTPEVTPKVTGYLKASRRLKDC